MTDPLSNIIIIKLSQIKNARIWIIFWKFKIYRFTNYHYTLEPGPWYFLAFFLEKLTTGIKKKEWPLDCFHPKMSRIILWYNWCTINTRYIFYIRFLNTFKITKQQSNLKVFKTFTSINQSINQSTNQFVFLH